MTFQLKSIIFPPMQTFPGGNIVMPVRVLRGRRRTCQSLPDELKEVHSESMPPLIAIAFICLEPPPETDQDIRRETEKKGEKMATRTESL